MKYLQEFRSGADAESILGRISRLPLPAGPLTLMEVCGSHTMAIHRFGIRRLLPASVRLISGPGCPVCVTGIGYVDHAVALAERPDVTLVTFGDMMRVPGSRLSLAEQRARGADIRPVYSPLDALRAARELPLRQVVFLAVGFETTSPTIAAALHQARREGLGNFSVLVGHKRIPPAMAALTADPALRVDGFLCPAHVSAIIGVGPYDFLARQHGKPCVIAGFEPSDILRGVELLLRQMVDGRAAVENEYARVVRPEGNPAALRLLDETFQPCDDHWRGLGVIPRSGDALRDEWAGFDAARRFPVELPPVREPDGCRCGDVLKGLLDPPECPLFDRSCTPEAPVGACMVSSEGTCAAWYRYLAS